tara:strand:+ start:458 stop:955 length:498 start_codon:yes stop_codon:yes gene_type:complete
MAVINVTSGDQVILTVIDTTNGTVANVHPTTGTNGLVIPLVQDVTVNATPGTVRYSTLDSTASSAFTTVNENSLSLNMLVDDNVFFGDKSNTVNSVANVGLLGTSINKQEVHFSLTFEGVASGDNYITGKGFIGGLAPTSSIDQAVFISPAEIIINGEITNSVVP